MIKFGSPTLEVEDHLRVQDVLHSGQLTKGPFNRDFEAAWGEHVLLGEGFSTTTSSCMGALHLAAILGGLGEGDEVICPAMSFVATANAIEITGATPVFVDCELETGNIDLALLQKAITPETKGIFVVHFAGIPLDMRIVEAFATANGLWVVEDCALAPGATIQGKSVGLWGDVGCFSFHPVKHIATGEGGMLVSKHEDLTNHAAHLKSFGIQNDPPMYDAPELGLNYRMPEMSAALGVGQTRRLKETLLTRRQNFTTLKHGLEKLGLMVVQSQDDELKSADYCLVAYLGKERDAIRATLLEKGIETSIYYPHPIPRLSYYSQRELSVPLRKDDWYPNATKIADESIAFPVGQHLNLEDMKTITRAVKQIISPKGVAQ